MSHHYKFDYSVKKLWMTSMRHDLRVLTSAISLVLIAGCATTNAPPDTESPVIRRTPEKTEELGAAQSLALSRWAVPFARIAAHVYCKYKGDDDRACDKFPDLKKTGWAILYHSQTELNETERASGLEFMAFARLLEGEKAEQAARSEEGNQTLEGLQSSAAKQSQRGEIVIGFRGTDFTSAGDWRANLRWVTRFLPLPGNDQYEIVHQHAKQLINLAEDKARQVFPSATGFDVYTTGHSLGGGLAQLLAYSDVRVAGAVVFDSSPVTGYSSIVLDSEVNCSRVMRMYERGEGLSYLRSFLRRFYGLSSNINEASFDFIHTGGNPIANHSMAKFREGLEARGNVNPDIPVAITGLPGTPDCDCYRKRMPTVHRADVSQCASVTPPAQPFKIDVR